MRQAQRAGHRSQVANPVRDGVRADAGRSAAIASSTYTTRFQAMTPSSAHDQSTVRSSEKNVGTVLMNGSAT